MNNKIVPANARGIFYFDHSLASYTSWRIGGAAQYFYQPADLEDLAVFLQNWQGKSVIFLGAGSNVLIRDGGINGLVIHLRDRLNILEQVEEDVLRVEAGVLLAKLVQKCADLGMINAMFLAGIPGALGGALAMNAGAYGDSVWEHVGAVETIDKHGKIHIRKRDEFKIGYRQVIGLKKNEWFVAGHLKFPLLDKEEAKEKMLAYITKRRATQPLDEPNCGSVFRNPKNDFAARLIEVSGLKGARIGDAEVSEKHANFIVNKGHAKAFEVEALIDLIKERVLLLHGIDLVPEVRILGQ